MDDWNDPLKLATDDEQINKMVHAFKLCFIKQRPNHRKSKMLRQLPYFENCVECLFSSACYQVYSHYCNLSVTKVPLDSNDYKEFEISFNYLRVNQIMVVYPFYRTTNYRTTINYRPKETREEIEV